MDETISMNCITENTCSIENIENMDYSLLEATLESFQTKSILPILKEELKLKIQTKRMAAGKEELPTTVFKEPEKVELTEDDKRKREQRKERNRIAATKCRNRRKSNHENLKTTLAEMELKNYTLKRKVEDLELEKERVIKCLKSMGQHNLPPVPHPPLSPCSTSYPNTTNTSTFYDTSVNIPKHASDTCSYYDTNSTSVYNDHVANTVQNVHPSCHPSSSCEDLPREMEYMNWIPPRFPEPRPCSSTCTMDESWQDDLLAFDEVDGDVLKTLCDKPKAEIMTETVGDETQHPPRYFLPLIPVFEDDATVPGDLGDTPFHGRADPTSPTFY